jgi:hypothetical protein
MEWNHTSVRPQREILKELIGAKWVCRELFLEQGNEVLCLFPTQFKRSMPERIITKSENLPHTILQNVFIFIYSTFPPLAISTREIS